MQTTIQSQQFNFLLKKVKSLKDGEKTIIINKKITLQFRYCTVRVQGTYNEQYLKFPHLNPNAHDEDVTQLVFDVAGLHDQYLTEVGVFREEDSHV
jgi:hypothetical protein